MNNRTLLQPRTPPNRQQYNLDNFASEIVVKHHNMESILVGNLFTLSQIQTNEASRMRDIGNANAHRQPAYVDALELIERWVRLEKESEKLLEILFFLSKRFYNRHISIMSM